MIDEKNRTINGVPMIEALRYRWSSILRGWQLLYSNPWISNEELALRSQMEKYRVRLLIDRLDKPGTETAEIHLGNVHTTDIAPILELAKRLTPEFGKLDEVAKK